MKPLKIIWMPQAQQDLRDIREFISRDAPVTADIFVRRIRSAVSRLRQFPESGAVVRERKNPNIREIFQGSYRIIYRIQIDRIEVLTVFHGARLLDSPEA